MGVSLRDVDLKSVTLVELFEFIEAMRNEFPAAVRVLEKKLGVIKTAGPTEYPIEQELDDEKIIASLELLKGSIGQQAVGEVSSRFVLGMHKEFGFGRIRMLRAFMSQTDDDKVPTAEDLEKWCQSRGIDYNEVFAYGSKEDR